MVESHRYMLRYIWDKRKYVEDPKDRCLLKILWGRHHTNLKLAPIQALRLQDLYYKVKN